VQGLFGGAGAILLWEAFLKPARERRSLAHMLAEEIGLNIQHAAAQLSYAKKHNPKGIPADFVLSEVVFNAVAARVGELPALAGDVVHLYQRVATMNRLPTDFSETLDRLRDLEAQNPADARVKQHRDLLDNMLVVYRSSLDTFINLGNEVLPKLREAARPWYRLDLLLRKPKYAHMTRIERDVDEHQNKLQTELRRARGEIA
jgi:hypothetical protein